MSREQILSHLKASLASNRQWLLDESQKTSHTPPPYVLAPADDLAEQFAAELRKLEGKVYLVADDGSARDQITELLTTRGATQVIAWDFDQIGLPELDVLLSKRGVNVLDANVQGEARKEQLQRLEPALVCISGADIGIAESGSLLLRHGPGRPRLASLLAPYHIAILRRGQIVRGLGEALALLGERYGAGLFADTSNLTLITGPSRTADIEMTLTLGIHGPREIHVVLIAEGASPR